jgi:AcrR family transcriptional regulator
MAKISREERRKQILEIAWRLCAEKGFSGTTMDDIADGAGVSRALVIQHFGSKEGVYDALWESLPLAHPLVEDLQVRKCMEEKDDAGVLRSCGEHVFDRNLRDAEHSTLRLARFSMLENPALFRRFSEMEEIAWARIVSYFEARREEGALRPVDYRSLIMGYRAVVVHLVTETMHREQAPKRDEFCAVIDTMISSIMDGIKP